MYVYGGWAAPMEAQPLDISGFATTVGRSARPLGHSSGDGGHLMLRRRDRALLDDLDTVFVEDVRIDRLALLQPVRFDADARAAIHVVVDGSGGTFEACDDVFDLEPEHTTVECHDGFPSGCGRPT